MPNDTHETARTKFGVASAVEPTRSQNMTVNWRRSASGDSASAAGMVETAAKSPEAAN